MKVLLVNGSPHKNGCVYTALSEVGGQLKKHGVDFEIFHIGTAPVRGCIVCGACAKLGKCAFNDDVCNPLMEKMLEADGIIIGSPVYYAGTNGALCAVLDRAFYASQGRYWNSIHGTCAEEALQDEEGLQTMRTLADHMVWMLRSIDAAGLEAPAAEPPRKTNFIR